MISNLRGYYMLLGSAAAAPAPSDECSPFTPPPAIGGVFAISQSAVPALASGATFHVCEPIVGV